MSEHTEEFKTKLNAALQWFFNEAPFSMTVKEARTHIRATWGEDVERELARIGNNLQQEE